MSPQKIGVAAIIYNKTKDQILLLKRGPESRNEVGKWENPGGQLISSITPEERIKQKIKEEIGVDIEIACRLFRDVSKPDATNTTWQIDVFDAIIISGKPYPVQPPYCSEVRWFPISELRNVDLASYTRSDFLRLGYIQDNSTVKQGVALVIFNQAKDQVLLLKRGSKSRNESGKWENPGGSLEPGETIEDGIKREVMEEIGVEVNLEEKLFNLQEKSYDDTIWSIWVYKGTITDGIPRAMEPEKCSEVRWFKINDLAKVDLTSYSRMDFIRLGYIPNPNQ